MPESFRGYGGGPSYRDLVNQPILFNRLHQEYGRRLADKYYFDADKYRLKR